MVLFRLIAVIFIVAGLLCVGYDVISSLQGGQGFKAMALSDIWSLINQGSLDGYRGWVDAKVPNPGSSVSNAVLGFPAFAVLGGFGIVLALLFQRRSRYDD